MLSLSPWETINDIQDRTCSTYNVENMKIKVSIQVHSTVCIGSKVKDNEEELHSIRNQCQHQHILTY